MNLTIKGELAKKLYTLAKKDPALARALATQWLDRIDATRMYEYLLDQKMVVELLTQRLQKAPEKTLAELMELAAGKPVKRSRGDKKVPRAARVKQPKAAKPQRQRFTAAQVTAAKNAIKAHLAKSPGATRKQLGAVAKIPTQAIYRRIISELKDSGEVVSSGEKSKTVYALKSAARKAPRKPARRGPARGRKTNKSKKGR